MFWNEVPYLSCLRQVREIYTKCAVECITNTPAFRECMQLLSFQSQVKLVESVKSALKVVNTHLQNVSPVKPLRSTPTKNNISNVILNKDFGDNFVKAIRVHLLTFLRQIENANTEATVMSRACDPEDDVENNPGNRYKLKEVKKHYYF